MQSSNNRFRVVITSMGIYSAAGNNPLDFYEHLVAGCNRVKPVTRFDVKNFSTQIAAEIEETLPLGEDRAHYYAKKAVAQCGLSAQILNSKLFEIYAGMTTAGHDFINDDFAKSRQGKHQNLNFYHNWFPHEKFKNLIETEKIDLPIKLFSTGCTSSTDALGFAFEHIALGRKKIILCVAAEAPIHPLPFVSFCAMGAFSKCNDDPVHASRPFDAKRDGFVLSEGSAALVLEEYEHALNRGAKILGEVVGYGTTLSAYHMNRPDPEGVESARAMKMAIEEAQIKPAQVGYIAYHGSSTQLNEKSETNAVKKAFGKAAYQVPGSSIKSMVGHALGPAGAMQSVAALMALEQGVLPPTINYEFPDPDCDLDYIPNVARKKEIEYALVNSSGFGGKNSTLIFKKLNS